jgi:hypothetical protein
MLGACTCHFTRLVHANDSLPSSLIENDWAGRSGAGEVMLRYFCLLPRLLQLDVLPLQVNFDTIFNSSNKQADSCYIHTSWWRLQIAIRPSHIVVSQLLILVIF